MCIKGIFCVILVLEILIYVKVNSVFSDFASLENPLLYPFLETNKGCQAIARHPLLFFYYYPIPNKISATCCVMTGASDG